MTNKIIMKEITYKDLQQLTVKVDNIIEHGKSDDELAHSEEDALLHSLVCEFCPEYIKSEIKRLGDADFQRWCA